ncbi:4'-phosphopantetheinyl transferase family protein [Microvirga puerhi]|uniref:4'-phosphopantetheinyl transferase family protein n=1 Tax=Microvirga puerhi TaxID=2876078 RepID=UPI003F721554
MSDISAQLGVLNPGEVHCWRFNPCSFNVEELVTVLSSDEHDRAARFLLERDRAEYIVCRGVLRHLLAAYGSGPPAALTFEYLPQGKPILSQAHAPRVEFNLTHSHDAALIGVAHGAAIGVDLERVRIVEDFGSLVSNCFAPEEQVELMSLPEGLRAGRPMDIWTDLKP